MKIFEIVEKGYNILKQKNIADADIKAKELFYHIFDTDKSKYIAIVREEAENIFKENTEKYIKNYESKILEIAQNIPYQYITGKTYFIGNEIQVTKDTLIPRFDSEILVEQVVEQIIAKVKKGHKNIKILEVGVGSGALICGIISELVNNIDKKIRIEIFGMDISKEALKVAEKNIQKTIEKNFFKERKTEEIISTEKTISNKSIDLKVELENHDIFEYMEKDDNTFKILEYDIIYSNPPYITEEEMRELDEEVKKEPYIALYGGKDGLDYYTYMINKLSNIYSNLYKENKMERNTEKFEEDLIVENMKESKKIVIFEYGYKQYQAIEKIAKENGVKKIHKVIDMEGRDRVVILEY